MLGYWTDDQFNETDAFYRQWYLIILAIVCVCFIIRGLFFSLGAVYSSMYFHSRLLDRVLRASSAFFDVTPVGRILNRFSKDLDAVDTMLPNLFMNSVTLSMTLLGQMIMVATIIPWMALAGAIVVVLFALLQSYYSPAAIQTQRIESNTRSPLFQQFSETLKGITTIRSFGKVSEFQVKNFDLLNRNTQALYTVRMVFRWGSLRIGMLQACLIFAAVLLVVLTRNHLDVGMAGVVLTSLLAISGMVGFLVMMTIELASRMNSVERLGNYVDSVPSEASLDEGVNGYEPPQGWPSKVRFILCMILFMIYDACLCSSYALLYFIVLPPYSFHTLAFLPLPLYSFVCSLFHYVIY